MANNPIIESVDPEFSIPGGEISLECRIEQLDPQSIGCTFNGVPGTVSAASNKRALVRVPEGLDKPQVEVRLSSGDLESEPFSIQVGRHFCGDMHIVANPAVDPKDDSIIVTRSGTRGQELPSTLFRVREGEIDTLPASVMNPTGVAFDGRGRLFVTNRADGEVSQIMDDGEALPLASDLGVATGIAFSTDDVMHVGDRQGSIFRISALGDARVWANLEPSVSAYHLAFGAGNELFVSAPGLFSSDVVQKVSPDGSSTIFYKGLGRPQGLAFDVDGNLYIAACLGGRHGIVRIAPDGSEAEMFVAGMNVVGLCFERKGGMIVATADSLFRIDAGIKGTLLE